MTDTADLVKRLQSYVDCGVSDEVPVPVIKDDLRDALAALSSTQAELAEALEGKAAFAADVALLRKMKKKLEAELAEAKQMLDRYCGADGGRVFDPSGKPWKERAEAAEAWVKELEAALKPFAAKADLYEENHPAGRYPVRDSTQITHRLGDFRASRAAFKTSGKE